MNCHGVEQLLSRYFDFRLPAKDRRAIAIHLEGCVNCTNSLKKLHQVSALATPLANLDAPESLWQKLNESGPRPNHTKSAESRAWPALRQKVPTLLRSCLYSKSQVVFPGKEIAQGAWEFGRLDDLPPLTTDEIVGTIVHQAHLKLHRVLPPRDIVLVCFSRPIHQCGMRFAKRLLESGSRNVHVVMADDYYRPTLYCSPRELRGQFVVAWVDVHHSGSLLDRLCDVCTSSAPCHVIAVTVIDQAPHRVGNTRRYALWTEEREERTPFLAFSFSKDANEKTLRFFNADTGRASTLKELPAEIAELPRAHETIERDLNLITPLLPFIEETGALQSNRYLYGVCYSWVLDLIPLLDHPMARAEIIRRAQTCLADLKTNDRLVPLVFPAERHQRAGRWAKEISATMAWPLIPIGWKNRPHYRWVKPSQRRLLSEHGRIIVIDAAIRSGKTLQSITDCVRAHTPPLRKEIVAFYAFNGLFERQQNELETRLGVRIRSLFRLPFGPPIDPAGRRWRSQLKEALADLGSSQRTDNEPDWVALVREFCERQLQQNTRRRQEDRPSKSMDTFGNLQRALEEGQEGDRARLRDVWNARKRGALSRLDVQVANRDPRVRNILHGAVGNHVCPSLRESAALGLSTLEDYSWLTPDWMGVHHKLFRDGKRSWQLLAYLSYLIKRKADPLLTGRMRQAVEDFEQSQRRGKLFLEPELQSGCQALLTLLSQA